MSAAEKAVQADIAPRKRPAYDPSNLDPRDEEARKYDDNSEGIDWDEIIATTQDDFEAGNFAFDSADYATDEEAMAAMKRMMDSILEDVLERVRHETAATDSLDAARNQGR